MVWDALEIIDALIPMKSAKCKGLLLPGVGGHSVHGHENPGVHAHRSMVVDRFGLRIGGDEMKLPGFPRQHCAQRTKNQQAWSKTE